MKFISDLWKSFLSLPLWVRLWVLIILVPINMASLAFTAEPKSTIIISLALAGITFNLIPLWLDRGFTSAMAVPHIIFWAPLVIVLIYQLFFSGLEFSNNYHVFLILLLVCDSISLFMDIPDALRWAKDRRKN
jgi:hypothetical protein